MSNIHCNKLSAKSLIDTLRSSVQSPRIDWLQCDSNPIKIDFEGTIYNIYLRNISHGGGSYPVNTTRAQLPKLAVFEPIIGSDERFLFLGYAAESNVFVCWDPAKLKLRLNKKNYVSLFSRKSIQDSVEDGNPKQAILSNGDKFVAFKPSDFESFLTMIEHYFPSLGTGSPISENDDNDFTKFVKTPQPKEEDIIGILTCIENDPSVKILVDSLRENESKMSIIAKCMNEYGADYPKMEFIDWGTIINNYLQTNNPNNA